jgi:hypothetical protein
VPRDGGTAPELRRARGAAWALTYYLMNNRLDDMLNYLQELRKLPRDVEYDAGVLRSCFAHAFRMGGEGSNAGQLDMARVQTLAEEWLKEMSTTQLELEGNVEDVLREAQLAPGAPR